jgi:transcriptional/translational regulatory protein YebC/TACO1
MFEQRGVVTIVGPVNEDALLEAALEGGAESYEPTQIDDDREGFDLYCEPTDLESLSNALQAANYTIEQVENRWIPSNTIEVTEPDHARSLLKMMDALEDLDDVQSVTANFDMTDELMAASVT